MRQLTWFERWPPVNDSTITDVEATLGVRFPEEYREFVKSQFGGMPIETDFLLDDPRKKNVAVGEFLAMDKNSGSSYIVEAKRLIQDRVPAMVVPIAAGPGGDYVCFDYRASVAPTVVYWHHDRIGAADEYTPVSATFGDFLEMLYEPDVDSESELD